MVTWYPSGSAKVKVRPNGPSMGADVIAAPAADEVVVHPLRVVGANPEADADAGLGERVEVDARQRFPHGEGDGLGGEDDRVGRRDLGAIQAEVLFVERGRALEVAHLQRDEVGSDRGHVFPPCVSEH